ncbi:MAG TPA: lactonase family protein [Bacteroidales bacterium]|nr:lactonase family protein [Bacteroidales bacterium]
MKSVIALISLSVLLLIVSCNSGQGKKKNNTSKNQPQTMMLFVGTNTGDGSQGIYSFTFDSDSGKLGNKQLAAETSNPTYLVIDSTRQYVYSVNEDDNGAVSSFRLDQGTGRLSFISQQPTHGAWPCYIDVNKAGNHLAVANYGTGNVAFYKLDSGRIEANPIIRQQEGSGPNKDRQEGPHAHLAKFGPWGKFLYSNDLGTDKVYAYPILEDGSIGEEQVAMTADPGDGPRHLVFNPSKKLVFVINELSGSIISAKVDPSKGTFERIDKVSTLPDDFTGTNTCADIHLSNDGKFLYGSNRGHNSIAVFSVNEAGELKKIQTVPVQGNWPRNFTLTPEGNYLLVANKKSGNIVVFRVDKKTGLLTPTGHHVAVASPVCLKFY